MHKAFAAAGTDGGPALERDINALLDRFNMAGAASLVVPAEYLEVVITNAVPDEGQERWGALVRDEPVLPAFNRVLVCRFNHADSGRNRRVNPAIRCCCAQYRT